MYRMIISSIAILLLVASPGVNEAQAGSRVNDRASDRAMEALRLDFRRDGVTAQRDAIVVLYNESCKRGYRPACGYKAWHSEDGSDLKKAAEVFEALCGQGDSMACVVSGWNHEARALESAETKQRTREYVLAAKDYKFACDTSGYKGIAGCYELARFRAEGKGMPVSTQLAYELHEWTCRIGYQMSCVGLARLTPQQIEWSVDRKGNKSLKKNTAGELYERACNGGVAHGCYYLGELMKEEWTPEEVQVRFSELCESGYHEACLMVADSFAGEAPEMLEGRANALGAACALGNGEGCFLRAKGMETGKLGPSDLDKAGKTYTKGCEAKYARACAAVGRLIVDGQFGADRSVAAGFLKSGCDGGVVAACVQLGNMYLYGEWVEKDSTLALPLLRPGCVDGQEVHPKACKGLALIYGEGRGVTRDRTEAARYLGISCDLRDLESCFLQGEQFAAFRSDGRYDGVALASFLKACEGGVTPGCVPAAHILEQGAVALRDEEKAVSTYEKACASSVGDGCLGLGSLLERGGGVSPDFPAAREAFRRGMEAGSVESQRRYARMVWHGLGGKKKKGKAKKLYRDACERGLSKACAGWRL